VSRHQDRQTAHLPDQSEIQPYPTLETYVRIRRQYGKSKTIFAESNLIATNASGVRDSLPEEPQKTSYNAMQTHMLL
jgi:hypothetical protein